MRTNEFPVVAIRVGAMSGGARAVSSPTTWYDLDEAVEQVAICNPGLLCIDVVPKKVVDRKPALAKVKIEAEVEVMEVKVL